MALCFSQRRLLKHCHCHCCHRGLWEMIPKTLLLLLALMTYLGKHVHCQSEDISGAGETEPQNTNEFSFNIQNVTESARADAQILTNLTHATTQTTTASDLSNHTHSEDTGSELLVKHSRKDTSEVGEQDSSDGSGDSNYDNKENLDNMEDTDYPGVITIVGVATALALFLIGLVVAAVVLNYRSRKGISGDPMKEDPYMDGGEDEKVPMPMFEDDVPSVMELEMEDLEMWMIKGGGGINTGTKQKQFS